MKHQCSFRTTRSWLLAENTAPGQRLNAANTAGMIVRGKKSPVNGMTIKIGNQYRERMRQQIPKNVVKERILEAKLKNNT